MRNIPSRRVRFLAALGVLIAAVVLTTTLVTPTASHADSLGECTSDHGAIVAVDFGHWGGRVARGCDAAPTTGMNLLHNGGFTTTGTQHDGPGFICRIGTTGFDDGSQYPTAADEACASTPPVSAYWSFWLAMPGDDQWSYSPLGALSDVPVDGEVEAWTFGSTDIGGTTGQPDFSPDSVRATGASASPSASSSPSASPSSSSSLPSSPVPAADLDAATRYLDAQLVGGDHVFNPDLDAIDYNQTAQLGVALAATGKDDVALAAVVGYLTSHILDAIDPDGDASPDPQAVGNIALLIEVTGGDPRDVGGQDLIAALTDHICSAPGGGGTCVDTGDFNGTSTPAAQATGLLVLARDGVAVPEAATTALTEMQCADGGFPGSMVRPGDFCDPENDMTGLAMQALTAVGGHTGVLASAKESLLKAQQSDGGFLPYTGASDSDTASTALDAQALTILGEGPRAASALSFVVSRQQDDGGFAADITTDGSDIYPTLPTIPAVAGTNLATLSHALPPVSSPVTGPDLAKGSAYLVDPANLIDGHYYTPFGGGFADWGLTIDGAFALAATGKQNVVLARIVAYIDSQGTDGTDSSISGWTGIGTAYATGGSLAKEALLAEVVGKNPRAFGGHDLITALDQTLCTRASTGTDFSCAAPGNYAYAASVFSQALGVIAQIRAGDLANAHTSIAYLESLQNADGSFPALIPSPSGVEGDVDSTAMGIMALALVPGQEASVTKGVAWIAGQQNKDGSFPGAAGDSVNSAALAIQGLSLERASHQAQIAAAEAFLASQQNNDGGFSVAAGGQPGSDVRASAQAVGGAVGTSFATLAIDLGGVTTPPDGPTPSPSHSAMPHPSHTATPHPTPSATKHPSPTATEAVTSTRTATSTATATTTTTATATVTTSPTLPAQSGSAGALAGPAESPGLTAASTGDANEISGLWWLVLAVAMVVAATVAALFWRRGRLTGSARHATTKVGS